MSAYRDPSSAAPAALPISAVLARYRGALEALDGRRLKVIEVEKLTPSCSKGCAVCCNVIAEIYVADALLVAAHLRETGRWAELAPALLERARVMDAYTSSEADCARWFDRGLPCLLLDGPTGACSVYAARPYICRSHLVVSDPALCRVMKHVDRIAIEEDRVTTNAIHAEREHVERALGLPPAGHRRYHGRLPAMVHAAGRALAAGSSARAVGAALATARVFRQV